MIENTINQHAVAFISGISVLISLISSTSQLLEVSLALIMIYIKKNRCEMSEKVSQDDLRAEGLGR